MSNYKGHSYFNILLLLPIAVAVIYFFITKETAYIITFGCTFAYGTLFMSPDSDVANKIKLFSIRGFFSFPFRTYAGVFKHRGLSHSLLFGTLTRIAWLALYAIVVLFIIYKSTSDIEKFYLYLKQNRTYLIYGFAGLFLADIGHLSLDKKIAR